MIISEIEAPILVIGYNRAWALKLVLEKIILIQPKYLYVNLDGPKTHLDREKINDCLSVIKEFKDKGLEICWQANEKNLGLRHAIPKAVNWVLDQHDRVIVIEDDAVPDISSIFFLNDLLKRYKDDLLIFNISIYSCISYDVINLNFEGRVSIYPDSYAWATWRNKWNVYDDYLPDFNSIEDMKILWNRCHGIIDFLSWRRELKNAREDLVNTWAYRWLYSLWKNNKFSINSNLNLVKYIGQDEGSNVKTRQKWKEIKVKPLPNKTINIDKEYEKYDFWMSKNVYRNKISRLVEIYLITVYLYLKRLLKP